MSYFDHIAACNNSCLEDWLFFGTEKCRLGAVSADFAAALAQFPDLFEIRSEGVFLRASSKSCDVLTQEIEKVAEILTAQKMLPPPRGEKYRTVDQWGNEPVFLLDRAFAPTFGIMAFGVHVNGLVRTKKGPYIWIGKRSAAKDVAPGKLDNMVAGGQPAGLGLMENVIKEGAEEADLPAALARQARPVSMITYLMKDPRGLKQDSLFVFDLELPETFRPRNTDGEIDGFLFMSVEEAMERVKGGDDFKFNVNLVLIDFFMRHGLLSPDNEPEYARLASGLRRF